MQIPTEFRGIPGNSGEFRVNFTLKIPRNSAKFRGIPYVFQKIPYSAESKKCNSVDTLVPAHQATYVDCRNRVLGIDSWEPKKLTNTSPGLTWPAKEGNPLKWTPWVSFCLSFKIRYARISHVVVKKQSYATVSLIRELMYQSCRFRNLFSNLTHLV